MVFIRADAHTRNCREFGEPPICIVLNKQIIFNPILDCLTAHNGTALVQKAENEECFSVFEHNKTDGYHTVYLERGIIHKDLICKIKQSDVSNSENTKFQLNSVSKDGEVYK